MKGKRLLLAAVPAAVILALIFLFSAQDKTASTQASRALAKAVLDGSVRKDAAVTVDAAGGEVLLRN